MAAQRVARTLRKALWRRCHIWEHLEEELVIGKTTVPCERTSSSLVQDPFLTVPGQPLPGEGDGQEQVLAVGRLLYLGQAQSAQEGTYTCECSNAAGTSSQEQQLEVLGEPARAGENGRVGGSAT